MLKPLLLCTDLDRTLIPNGKAPESPEARALFHRLAARPEVILVYASGRHLALLKQAIRDYDLPLPDYAIGDVGTTLYAVAGEEWTLLPAWSAEIAPDWAGFSRKDLAEALRDVEGLRLQEESKQNTFKLSYSYTPAAIDTLSVSAEIQRRLAALGVRSSLIWSIDEVSGEGLLDILPQRATKLHAIRFLARLLGIATQDILYAGDSGNDLPVLASEINAVLVNNAHPEVKRQALWQAKANGQEDRLYLARGGAFGMNGNYAAGILEGVAHFHPAYAAWLKKTLPEITRGAAVKAL